jgi:hypothetical protein
MSVSLGTSRLVALALGLTLLLAGLAILAIGGGSPASIPGWWLAIGGAVLLVGTLIERSRYRSNASDGYRVPAGPGGGEPTGTTLDPRFRRTDEVFADPTSGHQMRVWTDPSSGERRYLAED